MQCRLLQEKDEKYIKGVRVANSVFKSQRFFESIVKIGSLFMEGG